MKISDDITRLVETAQREGRAAFTYATFLRVTLDRPWRLCFVVMEDTPMAARIVNDALEANLKFVAAMVKEEINHRGDPGRFSAAHKVEFGSVEHPPIFVADWVPE